MVCAANVSDKRRVVYVNTLDRSLCQSMMHILNYNQLWTLCLTFQTNSPQIIQEVLKASGVDIFVNLNDISSAKHYIELNCNCIKIFKKIFVMFSYGLQPAKSVHANQELLTFTKTCIKFSINCTLKILIT